MTSQSPSVGAPKLRGCPHCPATRPGELLRYMCPVVFELAHIHVPDPQPVEEAPPLRPLWMVRCHLCEREHLLTDIAPEGFGTQKCRVCGCTENTACSLENGDGCAWAEDDLCTACSTTAAAQ